MGVKTILIATDRGVAGEQAIEAGLRWADRHQAKVIVLHVLKDPSAHDVALAELTQRVAQRGEVRVVLGDVAEQILAIDADLVVLGGRDAAGRIFGRVAERVVSRASVPVLIARAEHRGPIIAATDFSEPSLPAVAAARDISVRSGDPITIMHVIERHTDLDAISSLHNPAGADREEIDEARERLRALVEQSPDEDRAHVTVGDPARSICAYAADVKASLVVVASHGRTGVKRLLMGSVAEKVARDAPCSVLVMRMK